MTAKEEDILTNTNYINNGSVIDKLLKSLIVSPINFDDLLIEIIKHMKEQKETREQN